ncbi:UNVERIFIED_CONTAM: hypothetical protein FKN15_054341 [Acipenser sinensis]
MQLVLFERDGSDLGSSFNSMSEQHLYICTALTSDLTPWYNRLVYLGGHDVISNVSTGTRYSERLRERGDHVHYPVMETLGHT